MTPESDPLAQLAAELPSYEEAVQAVGDAIERNMRRLGELCQPYRGDGETGVAVLMTRMTPEERSEVGAIIASLLPDALEGPGLT
jgi:hypothetical protein